MRALILLTLALLLTACEKAAQNMYNQPKYKPMAASTLWADGQSARPDVPGAVARSAGVGAGTSSGRLGEQAVVLESGVAYPRDASGRVRANLPPGSLPADMVNPLPVTMESLHRGQQRYNIYCAPCHSEAGDGDGMVVRRGFPQPQSFHSDAMRNAPDSHLYSVISDGYGVMYGHGDRIAPADRWAIVNYIRALQLSQNARVSQLTADERAKLEGRLK
jgi:mono/diheme cytochrome c family protein